MTKVLSEKDFQDQLSELEKKYAGKTVIANFFQLGREGNKFSRELKRELRKDSPVEMAHIVAINGQWANCGKLYEVDEEKTEEWQEKVGEHKENLVKRDKAEKLGAKKLASALAEMGSEKEEKVDEEKTEEGIVKCFAVTKEFKVVSAQANPDDITTWGDYPKVGTKKQCQEWIKKNKPS